MSQFFSLQLAPDTLSTDAYHLGVLPEQLKSIDVTVHATITRLPEPQLQLVYHIHIPNASLADQLKWPEWNKDNVNFLDYLWQQTCLECFIAVTSSENYVEINVSPSGNYALYQFQDYREPSILPPMRLLQADGKKSAHIQWLNQPIKHKTISTSKCVLDKADRLISTSHFNYKSSFGIALNQLSPSLFDDELFSIATYDPDNKTADGIYFDQIHPCVILWFGEVALYFATSHTSPPDFHQRRHWSNFS